jgi:hypothetical protein
LRVCPPTRPASCLLPPALPAVVVCLTALCLCASVTLWCCFGMYAVLLVFLVYAWGPAWLLGHFAKFLSLRFSEGSCGCGSNDGGSAPAHTGESALNSSAQHPLVQGGSSTAQSLPPGSRRQNRAEKLASQKTTSELVDSAHIVIDDSADAPESSASKSFLRDPYRKDDMGALFLDLLFIPVLRQCFSIVDCVPGPDGRMYVGSACWSNSSSSNISISNTTSCSNFASLPSSSVCWTPAHQLDVVGAMLLMSCLTYSSLRKPPLSPMRSSAHTQTN